MYNFKGKFPKRVELDLEAIRNGDEEEMQKAMAQFVPLALSLASKYGDPDYGGQALLILCECIHKAKDLDEDANLDGYVNRSIVLNLYRYYYESQLVKMPKGKEPYTKCDISKMQHLAYVENLELNDLLSHPWLSNTEQRIVQLLYEGYNLEQIGRQLGLSTTRISQIRKDIQRILKQWMDQVK